MSDNMNMGPANPPVMQTPPPPVQSGPFAGFPGQPPVPGDPNEISPEMIDGMKDEDLKILAHMLMDIRDNERREMEYAKKQSRFAVIISLLCLVFVVVTMVVVLMVVPKALDLIDNINVIVADAGDSLADVSVVLKDLNKVTSELAEQDIAGLFNNVDALVNQSQTSIDKAMSKVEQMDIESLNEAIRDLRAVVEPLAKLFGR